MLTLGVFVRQCNWSEQRCTPTLGVTILRYTLHILVNLLHGQEHNSEDIKTLVVALLTWSRWDERLPSWCLSEEPCEALLSRLVTIMCRYPTIVELEGIFDIFLITPRPKMDPVTLGVTCPRVLFLQLTVPLLVWYDLLVEDLSPTSLPVRPPLWFLL